MDEERREALEKRRKEDLAKQKKALAEKYKGRGIQRMSLAEYETAQRKKAARRPKIKLPRYVKFILSTPFIIIFLLGLLFLPYLIYLIATSPSSG